MGEFGERSKQQHDGREDETRRLLKRLVDEAEEACNARSTGSKVPQWVFPLAVSLIIQAIAGALFFGQFNGKFEEFRTAVYQRLDRIERLNDGERHRGPENYASPPIINRPR